MSSLVLLFVAAGGWSARATGTVQLRGKPEFWRHHSPPRKIGSPLLPSRPLLGELPLGDKKW